MAYDGDEPGGEAGAVVRLRRVGAQPPQVAFAQGCTYLREDVHYVVIVLGVVADGREDEAPIAVEKQVPHGAGSGRRQVDRPPFHPHDLQGDWVGYTLNAGSVKG